MTTAGFRIVLGIALLATSSAAARQEQAPSPPPKILLDTAPRAIEYQLGRLSNADLARVERKEDDPRYRLVYYALLTRKGLGREFFDEALGALTKLEKTSRARVLLEGLTKVREDDSEAANRLLDVLFAEPAEALRKDRDSFVKAAAESTSPFVLTAAYGGMMLADGAPEAAWKAAAGREGHLQALVSSVPRLAKAPELRAKLFDPISGLIARPGDPALRAAALTSLGWTRPDAATFSILAKEVIDGTDPVMRAAAVRSLQRIPRDAWPAAGVEPLARALVGMVSKTPPERRTDPETAEAAQLAETLTAALAAEPARALRRDLRALGVQVVRIETIPEQMAFDVKWFAVEAGKPVQIVLTNPDAMSHNLLIGKPGSLKEIGTAASAMTLPTNPKVKPYVPDSPLVLHATRLLNWGESERLGFVAPKEPGEYPFVCTFPGHWVRMYGVMLVVDNMEAWEAKPTTPSDPMTNQPFPSQRQ
jgi:azurin